MTRITQELKSVRWDSTNMCFEMSETASLWMAGVMVGGTFLGAVYSAVEMLIGK